MCKQLLPLALALFLILLPFVWLFLHGRRHGKHQPKLPPGPRPLPIIGNLHMLGQLPHRSLKKLAQKYGPIMHLRLGQVPTIVVSSADAAKIFLKDQDANFASRPFVQASKYFTYGNRAIAFTPYGDYWRRVRKLTTQQLLSGAKVDEFEPLRRAVIDSAVMRLKVAAEGGEVVDMSVKMGHLIEDIMFKMVVGASMTEDKKFGLKDIMAEVSELSGAFNIADYVPFFSCFDIQGLTRRMKESGKSADKIFESIIEDNLKEEHDEHHKDILSHLLFLIGNSSDEFLSPFTRENVKAIMMDLFSAGIETTSITIVWALCALLKHPRIMGILRTELDATVGRQRMVSETDLPKLPYLDAVVKETLRLFPAGPLLAAHESVEDTIVKGYKIPGKSTVIVNCWAIARDETTWTENCEEFYPERFLNKDIDVYGQNFDFIPFGSGRRGCPGITLGLVTVKIVLAQIVHCFEWELPEGMKPEEVDMTEKCGLLMPRAAHLVAKPTYRLH